MKCTSGSKPDKRTRIGKEIYLIAAAKNLKHHSNCEYGVFQYMTFGDFKEFTKFNYN